MTFFICKKKKVDQLILKKKTLIKAAEKRNKNQEAAKSLWGHTLQCPEGTKPVQTGVAQQVSPAAGARLTTRCLQVRRRGLSQTPIQKNTGGLSPNWRPNKCHS